MDAPDIFFFTQPTCKMVAHYTAFTLNTALVVLLLKETGGAGADIDRGRAGATVAALL